MSAEAQRLNRYLAACGLGSRRGVEALVDRRSRDDRRRRRHLARPARARGRAVALDGRPVAPDEHAYVLLHKPADVVTTVRDTHGRRTVIDLVGADRRLFPIGRLDADTTGLLLLTNDGDLAARLMHPRHGVEKTYEATVVGAVDGRDGGEAGRRASSWTGGARRRRACACCAPRAGRASSRSCCTRAASARCGACARRSATTCSRCTARPTPGLRLGTLAPGASRPLRPAELELLRSAAGELTWPRRASTAISRWRASARAAASRDSCARAAWRRRRRRPGAVGGRRARRDRDAGRRAGRRAGPGRRARRTRRRRAARRWPIRASCTWPGPRRTGASRCC